MSNHFRLVTGSFWFTHCLITRWLISVKCVYTYILGMGDLLIDWVVELLTGWLFDCVLNLLLDW